MTDLLQYPNAYPQLLLQKERDALAEKIYNGVERAEVLQAAIALYSGRYFRPLEKTQLGALSPNQARPDSDVNSPQGFVLELSDSLISEWIIQEVKSLYDGYDTQVKSEFDSLDSEIRKVFVEYANDTGNLKKWKGIGTPKSLVGINLKEEPWRYYQWLRELYYRTHNSSPDEELRKIQMDVFFLGRPVLRGAHAELAGVLQRAETQLTTDLKSQTSRSSVEINTAFGFQPRIVQGKMVLSNHFLGKAVDIDGKWNHHLTGQIPPAIDKVLDWISSHGETSATPKRLRVDVLKLRRSLSASSEALIRAARESLKEISVTLQAFLSKWLALWEETKKSSQPLNDSEKEALGVLSSLLDKWQAKIDNGKKNPALIEVEDVRDRGLFALPLELVFAIKNAADDTTPVTVGESELDTEVDAMHFSAALEK